MDEGWAALLGAAVGAVVGGGAAITAAWLGRGGMKEQAEAAIRQAEAMIRQTERQADADHAQWKRAVLRDACIEFVQAARSHVHAVHRYHALIRFDQQGIDQDPERIRQEYFTKRGPMYTACLALELENDDEIRDAALRVLEASQQIPHVMDARADFSVAEERTRLTGEAIGEFVRIARSHLEM
jgi:hypothetical protein